MPFMRGINMSVMTTAGPSPRMRARASSPSAAFAYEGHRLGRRRHDEANDGAELQGVVDYDNGQ